MRQIKVTVPDRLIEATQRYQIDVDVVCSEALYQALARQLPLLKLTPATRELLLEAEQEAAQLGHDFIGTEHILLAILSESHGVADAALRELGLIETVRAKLHEIMVSPEYNSSSNEVVDQTGALVGFMWYDKEGNQYIGDADRTPLRHQRLGNGRLGVLDEEGTPRELDQDGRLRPKTS